MACDNEKSIEVIQFLVYKYPKALQEKTNDDHYGNDGSLPLDFVYKSHPSDQVLHLLIDLKVNTD